MRTAILVAACLVVIPAGVLAWATTLTAPHSYIQVSPAASRVALARETLVYFGLRPTRCTSHGSQVRCATQNGDRCTFGFPPSGGGSGDCVTKDGTPIDSTFFLLGNTDI